MGGAHNVTHPIHQSGDGWTVVTTPAPTHTHTHFTPLAPLAPLRPPIPASNSSPDQPYTRLSRSKRRGSCIAVGKDQIGR